MWEEKVKQTTRRHKGLLVTSNNKHVAMILY